eukprot:GEMP01047300.1.p1 GENE.GEMP01047300.1~~GEMP01047300.1.p1  ORF type:complete len:137 (+),score=28.09 GEMP01047300.1:197-607(+)
MHGNQPSTLRRDSFSSRVPATPAEVYRNCSCGAGKILEDERDALEKKYESMRQRQEELADADLSMEARIYEANSEAVALASRQQACVERRCTVDAEKTIVETIMQHKPSSSQNGNCCRSSTTLRRKKRRRQRQYET